MARYIDAEEFRNSVVKEIKKIKSGGCCIRSKLPCSGLQELATVALDIINCQKAEIERLEKRLETQAEEFGKLREELKMALATKIENKIYIDNESYEKMTGDEK